MTKRCVHADREVLASEHLVTCIVVFQVGKLTTLFPERLFIFASVGEILVEAMLFVHLHSTNCLFVGNLYRFLLLHM